MFYIQLENFQDSYFPKSHDFILPLTSSNNIAENSIKPFTVGRKNWQFCGSPRGAEASACVYSLVETAKAHGLNPYK